MLKTGIRLISKHLGRYNIPIDPNLIVTGDFQRNSGTEAVIKLKKNNQIEFDALISANDNMAIGAMQELQAQGIRIPEDVIVAGFDDIEETRAIAPTLTTVRTPWHLLGSRSVDMVLAKLKGELLPGQILLDTELVCRQSCGCQPIEQTLPGSVPFNLNSSNPMEGSPLLERSLASSIPEDIVKGSFGIFYNTRPRTSLDREAH